jgi:hypothetical protein
MYVFVACSGNPKRFYATEFQSEFIAETRMPPFGKGKGMRIKPHSLSRLKAFLIEFTAFVSLLLVLVKIIVVEVQHLFR